MNRKHAITFIVFFLFVIYAVPAIQAGIEFKTKRTIQALDIVIDAIYTPLSRANSVHDLLVKNQKQANELITELAKSKQALPEKTWDPGNAEQIADEALFTIADVRKAAATVNRHVHADTTGTFFTDIGTIASVYSAILTSLRNGESPDYLYGNITKIQSMLSALITKNPKKTIVSLPVLATKNIPNIFWNDRYLRPFEKDMENQSVFATTIRPAMLYTRFVLFNDLGEKAVPGVNNWFFYKPDVDYLVKPDIRDKRSIIVDPNFKPVTDNPISAIVTFKKQLADMGIDLLVVIVPVKASIYPDMLNAKMSPGTSGKISHSLSVLKELNEKGVETVDLFSAFAQERLNDPVAGDSLYLQKDTHWKGRGLRTAAHVVADRIKQYPWHVPGTTSFTMDTLIIDRNGDIGVMTTLPAMRIHDLTMNFPLEKTKCYRVHTIMYDSATKIADTVIYKDDFKHSQILILGDSFSRIFQTDEPRSAGWIAHCAYELSQPVASIVNDGGASTLVRQSLARKISVLKGKKLVVWEVVERDFRFGEEGWKDVALENFNK